MAGPRKRIGEILVEQGRTSVQDVDNALELQFLMGGRIGTVLVARQWVQIDDLSRCLAYQHDTPEATRQMIASPDPLALSLISADACLENRVYPFMAQGKVLALAMCDPQDLKLVDHLSFRLGMSIRPHALPELRLYYCLEKFYGVPRQAPHLYVPDELIAPTTRRHCPPQQRVSDPPEPASFPNAAESDAELITLDQARRPMQASATPAEEDFDIDVDEMEINGTKAPSELFVPIDVIEPTAELLEAAARVEAPEPADGQFTCPQCSHVTVRPAGRDWGVCPRCGHSDLDDDWSLDDGPVSSHAGDDPLSRLIQQMEQATDRDTLLQALVSPVAKQASLTVLLLVRKHLGVGLAAQGTAATDDEIKSLMVPLNTPSALQHALVQKKASLGTVSGDSMLRMISTFLRNSDVHQGCVTPICLGDRVVNLLCTFSKAGTELGQAGIDDLMRLGKAAAAAYGRLIRQRKEHKTG
jgi:hypothetical protein